MPQVKPKTSFVNSGFIPFSLLEHLHPHTPDSHRFIAAPSPESAASLNYRRGVYLVDCLKMGSNKTEKKVKKMKKTKKRSRELVENGESTGAPSPQMNVDKYSVIEKDQDDVAGADPKAYKRKKARKNKSKDNPSPSESSLVANDGQVIKPVSKDSMNSEQGKLRKAHKNKKDGHLTNKKSKSLKDERTTNKNSMAVKDVLEVAMPDAYQISSGEEDETKGMQKWIKEFHQRRPGLKELQERIDNFITAHEEQEEQAKRERESKLAEEGWTVVVHRKGGKKTTDPESGVAVGSVAAAAVRDKLEKKKSKDIGLDFYRFQRKEAHRSELMKLQSKFEEDKKRIQQLRAARKFKPY